MTEWDHGGHDGGPDHHEPEVEPTWEPLGSEPAHLDPPEDPYGLPSDPGHHDPVAADDEPAGLPAEQPADWSGGHADLPVDGDLPGVEHSADPSAWDQPGDVAGDDGAPDGTDPADWSTDTPHPFPPALDILGQPGDGGPWVDADLLGGTDHGTDPGSGPVDAPAALLPDLAAADGDPDAGWDALRDSDDPAVRALAHHWNP